ncbi:unnamed protein product, partial [Ectocarpus sp. 4 AP-2014]
NDKNGDRAKGRRQRSCNENKSHHSPRRCVHNSTHSGAVTLTHVLLCFCLLLLCSCRRGRNKAEERNCCSVAVKIQKEIVAIDARIVSTDIAAHIISMSLIMIAPPLCKLALLSLCGAAWPTSNAIQRGRKSKPIIQSAGLL